MAKTVIIIAGPTAVGKTSVAIEVAKHFNTGIISADSRQCYRELDIGVARPSEEQLRAVKHYFVASHSIHEKVTAKTFELYALEKANRIFQSHDIVIMAGGTGLYIKAFCEGMDEIPEVPESIHQSIINDYKKNGIDWLQNEVAQLDPDFFRSGEVKNPQRLMRALEVFKATGMPINSFRKGLKSKRDFTAIKIALELPKEELHRNISSRVDQMLDQGLLEETRSLIPYQHLNALQTVGYKELFDHLNGMTTVGDAISLIKQNTRQYAKRQMTWFRKNAEYSWLKPTSEEVLGFLGKHFKIN